MDIEIYDKAHAILTERRTKAQSENNARIREINEKIPEIKEINDALFKTGKELIKVITESRGEEISAKIEAIKKRNMGAQQLASQLLTAHGYPADYLDIHYTCPICSDSGYNGDQFCICMKKLFSKLTTDKLNKSVQLKLSSFDTFSLKYYNGDDYFTMEKILHYAKNYAENFRINSESILIFGNTGLGKTHISLAIANVVLEKGFSVLYDSVINILGNIEREHFSSSHTTEMLDLVLDADLLILDDLGTEYESKFYNSNIYNIVNTRLVREKPTIINTNLELEALSRRYGGKVASRIATMYKCLNFKGDDVRFQLIRQNRKVK